MRILPAASAGIQWNLKRGLRRAAAQHFTDFLKEKCRQGREVKLYYTREYMEKVTTEQLTEEKLEDGRIE